MSKEIRNKAVGLTDEEAAAVTGGFDFAPDDSMDFYFCPDCNAKVFYPQGGNKPNCKCGYNPCRKVNPPAGGAGMAVGLL